MLQHLENANILDIYPLTPMQEGVYFHFLYDRQSPAFFVQLSYGIKGRIDLDLVRKSLEVLTDRHDILRTVFNHERKGSPLQVVLRKGNVDLNYFDPVRSDAEIAMDKYVDEFREEDRLKQFDLNKDVLMRVTVIRTGDQRFEFIWSFHHILMDGWCINVLIAEYNVIYDSLRKDKDIRLPAIRPYRDYIQWLQRQDQQGAKRYWRNYLKEYSGMANLPVFNGPVPEGLPDNGQKIVRFRKDIVHKLKEISHSFGVTVSLIIQAAWGIVLGRYKGVPDVVFGVVVSGRPATLEGMESMIGLFINTIPVRVSFNGMPFSALLIKMQQESLQSQEYNYISLSEIQSDTGLGKELVNHALVFEHFQDAVQYDHSPAVRANKEKDIQVSSAMSFEQSNYDLDLRIGFGENEGIIGLKYNKHTYSDETMSGIADYLYTLIQRITDDVHADCKDLTAITREETAFVDAAGFHAVDFPATRTAVNIIEEMADLAGDRTALVCGEDTFTYRELSRNSNAMAHLIHAQNIPTDGVVALLLPRGCWMAACMLGVWKAGCAYLPMDAEQPLDRLRWIIGDSGAGMLVTDVNNLKKAQQLQWSCPGLDTVFCMDTNFFYSVPEEKNESMGQELWEYIGQTAVDDITAGGWVSSYTGIPFSRAEMDEYVLNTVSKMSPHLTASSTVLEIGCASGLTMFALAGRVGKYVGIDLSGAIIAKNKMIAEEQGFRNIELYQMYAHEIHLLDKRGFDVIIINSVAQNFDGYNYLRGVISKCVSLLNSQGVIFFGDIMDLDRKDAFIDSLKEFVREQKDKAVTTKLDWTEELFIPRGFFDDLPALYPSIVKVQHSDKLHTLQNELTRFRFDTFLFVDKKASAAPCLPLKKQLDRTHLGAFNGLAPMDRSSPGGLSYIIYTSGSTGNPKGVMVEHAGMLNHLYAKVNSLSIHAGSRVLQNASATFDISVWQFFSALLAGGTTFVYDQATILNVNRLLERLVKDRITVAEFVPSYLDVLLEEHVHAPTALQDLTFLLVTGEAVSVDLVRRWFRAFPGIPMVNAYGPTEASDDITHHIMTEPPVTSKVPLGKPVQNMRIFILDKDLKKCPPGVRGEICVTGIGVGRGYINNIEKTRQVFIDNTLEPSSPYRIYRTGDTGCWLPDGTIEFYGREDYQVKIRGFRIELGEIECRLLATPGVRNAVVTDRMDAYGNKSLVAYVCLQDREAIPAEDLRKSLHHDLPEYMVPEQFVFLDAFPLTPNGKIDRKNLPDPLSAAGESDNDEPFNDIEEKLRRIWEQVLDKRPITLHDNFFRIGGHSLKATRVATGILKEMKVRIELRDIFAHPTLSGLAACIATQETTVTEKILPCPVQEYYPVSHSQKRMWLLSQFKEASLAYNVFNSWVLRGDIRGDMLEKALHMLVDRHEILRTTFIMIHSEPEQMIRPSGHFTNIFQYADLSSHEDPGQYKAAWLNGVEDEVFDLEAGPLFHLYLLKLKDGEYFCLLKMHHIVCDGWSMQLIFNELTTFYTSLLLGNDTAPAQLGFQYKDFAYWQTRQLEGKVFARHRNYWHEVLKGPLPSLKLPSFARRPELQTYNGSSHIHLFSRAACLGCKKLSEERQASLFMTLVAMVNTLFYHYTGQKDILMGTSVAGRFTRELEEQIGFYINTLALRSVFSERDSFIRLLDNTKENILNAFEHQQYPFDLIVDELSLERDLGRSAIFDVLIELQNYQHAVSDGSSGKKKAGFSISPQHQEKTRSIFDLNLEFREHHEDLYLSVTYNTDIYSAGQIEKMTIHLENLMRAVSQDPGRQLLHYELMDAREKKNMLSFNPAPLALEAGATACSLFAQQVESSPDKEAVSDDMGSKTYKELAVNARQIAGFISRIEHEPFVAGVLMDRSSHTIESIMGVWQAGGACLPLDPAATPAQLRGKAIRAGISVLLTTRAYVHLANELQWSCPCLRTIICLDSSHIYLEKEPVLESMNKEMWEMVGEKADDDITGGGWIDSYTGKPFSRAAMDEYAENTYLKLKPFITPDTRVLEIGCASGITLFRVAPETAYYLGTDLSESILRKNAAIAASKGLHQVSFQGLYAHEIDKLEQPAFDIIIINSVIQNFSGTNYLRDVLDKCIAKLKDKGIIYIGDVMDIELREDLLTDIERHRQSAGDGSAAHIDFSDHQFYSRIFFDDLSAAYACITEVTHSKKMGKIENELTRFRFDTILHIDKSCRRPVRQPARFQFDRSHIAIEEGSYPMLQIAPGGLACIMYGPGEAATARETRASHEDILAGLQAMTDGLGLMEGTLLLQSAVFDSAFSMGQLIAPLTAGARISIFDSGHPFNAGAFLKKLIVDKVQTAQVTPGQLSLLLEEVLIHPLRLPDLKVLGIAGDALPSQLVKHWYDLYPEMTLINMYGCAGVAGAVCHTVIERSAGQAAIPLGVPVPGRRIYVVNEAMQLCPEGVIGNICVAGVGVDRRNLPGYPDTAFIRDPFYGDSTEFLYRTGDRGRWLPGGTLSFHGRIEQHVNVRGQDIDLSEVENELVKAEGVKFAFIKDLVDERGDRSLVAYISLFKGHEEMDAAEIKRRVSAVLPEHMAPDEICVLETLPLDKSGRIDRSALQDVREHTTIKAAEAPRSLMEQQLAAIWEDVLHRKPIGIYDNFFALGGHSLKATRVVSRVRKELFIRLELSQIFTAPTLAQLTEVLARSSRTKFNKIGLAPSQSDYALSHAQQRIWFLDRLDPGLVAYNIPSGYILTGDLNREALEYSFQWLVHRHEILRTSFILKDGEPRQVINTPEQSGFRVMFKDLRDRPEAMKEAKAIYRDERLTPFDLEKGPLLRVQLVRLEDFQYALFFTIHHIISDGWSMDVIVKELLRNYRHLQADPGWMPDPLSIQYKDYSEWQTMELQGESTKMDREYWLNKFKTTPTVLDMPTVYVRPPIKSYAGDTRQFILPPPLTMKLKQLSQEHGVSTYIMLVAIVNLLLHRYTGQKDIILSTPVAGRDHADLDDQIGFYVNSLVLRTAVDGIWSFSTFLENVKQEVLQSFGHQFYPFDLLVEELELPRDMSRSPLFDIMVTYWEYNGVRSQTNDTVRIEPFATGSNVSKLDLTFHFVERANSLGVDIEYCTAVFDGDSMDRMSAHLLNLINAVCLSPAQRIGEMSFLTEEEMRCKPEADSRGEVMDPGQALLHHFFAEHAVQMPGVIAVHTPSEILTWPALDEAADRMADLLRDKGIRPGDRVGVTIDWSAPVISTILSILKLEAVCVPVAPGLDPEHIQYIIKDAGLSLLFTQASDWMFTSYPAPASVTPMSQEPIAFIIYDLTSGRHPVKIEYSHRSLIRLMMHDTFPLDMGQADRCLLYSFPEAVFPLWQVLHPLLRGAALYIPQQESRREPGYLTELLLDHAITILLTAPAAFYSFAGQAVHMPPSASLKLRYVIFEQALLKPGLLKKWQENYPGVNLMHTYTPGQSAVPATIREIDPYIIRQGQRNLGRPLPGQDIRIFSEMLQPVPFRTLGEIAVACPAGDWRLTGDLARQLPNGEIVYAGRKESQVYIRGHRVQFEEVQQALIRAGAGEAAVATFDRVSKGDTLLVAYVSVTDETNLEQVKRQLQDIVPDPLIPGHFILMDVLPLNVRGEIDHRSLPYPDVHEEMDGYMAPVGETEKKIAGIWQEILGVESIGRKDNFFQLGGHSLKAVRIISAIAKTWNAPLSLRDIFLHPTVEEIGHIVNRRAGSYREQSITPAIPRDHYPVSHAQKRLWVLSRFEEAAIAYNMPYVLLIEGTLDILALKRAIYTITMRHEILRTVFDLVGEELRQFIRPEPFQVFEEHDIRQTADPLELGEILVKGCRRRSFDLKEGPLLLVSLIRLAEKKYYFIVNMHHIISDGWSMEIFGNELFTLYNAYTRGLPDPLPPLAIQYKDYSDWQHRQLQGDDLRRHQEYLYRKLSGPLPVLNIPAAKQRPPVRTSAGRTIHCRFSPEHTGDLRQFSKKYDTSLFVVLLSLLKALFHRYTGQQDIIIGVSSAGRMQKELESQIGFYINTLIIRTWMERETPYLELQQQVNTNMLEAMEHQAYPFDRLVEELNIIRDTSRSAVFDVLVEFQNFENDISRVGDYKEQTDLKISEAGNAGDEPSLFDLNFFFSLNHRYLECSINYNTDIYSDEQVQAFFRHLELLSAAVMAAPATMLGEFRFLSPAESAQMESWRRHHQPVPPDNISISDEEADEDKKDHTAPAMEVERRLTVIWEEILNKRPVGVLDDFFEMGGHSLKAARLVSWIQKEFSVKFEARNVFVSPTIRQLARIIGEAEQVEYQEILPAPQQAFYKASESQKQLWIFSQLGDATLAFNLDWAYRFEGDLDLLALQRAYHALIDRHESLRTIFFIMEGELCQVILPPGDGKFHLQILDLQQAPENVSLVEEYKYAEVTTPFQLEKGPLIRAKLLQTQPRVWYFLLTLHHIVADGWSIEILTRELFALYEGYKAGRNAILPPLKIQYKDFTEWLRHRHNGGLLKELQDYWHAKLEGKLPVLDLPSSKKRPANLTFNGQQLYFRLPEEIAGGLDRLALESRSSLFVVIMAVLKAVFYKCTGQTDIIIGTPVSGRWHKEIEGHIGLFINTLALRTKFLEEDRFSDLLGRVRDTVLDAFDHQEYPFNRVLSDKIGRRDQGRSPVFDVMVILQNIDIGPAGDRKDVFRSLKIQQLDNDSVATQGDLTFEFSRDKRSLQLTAHYNTDVFAQKDIQRLVAFFGQVAAYILEDTDALLKDIPLLLPEERVLLHRLHGEERHHEPSPADVLIAQTAAVSPGRPAVIDPSGSFTYGELELAATSLAHHLRRIVHVPREGLVAVALPRSARFISTVLAIWKAGMAYIPLDPSWPAERIRGIVKDSGLGAIIGEASWLAAFRREAPDIDCMLLDEASLSNAARSCSGAPLQLDRPMDDLACIIYTSGSTGKSKGAMIEHEGLLNHLYAKIDVLAIDEHSRVLQSGNLTFVISIWQCFAALLKGGTTVVYPEKQVMDIRAFINAMRADRITIAEVVPTYLNFLLEEAKKEKVEWPDLRYLVVTGEKLPKELTVRWFNSFNDIPLVNAYGFTEASDDITHHTMTAPPREGFVPLGVMIRNMRMYIVNQHMQLCPPGMKGEICVAGPGVGRGYIKDKQRTAAVFLDNPFEGGMYHRLYRTGDIGKLHPDGAIEYLGREDHQVKIRGHRIELGEIEQIAMQSGLAEQVVVVAKDDASGINKQLVGYAVAENFDKDALIGHLQGRLPSYMVPQIWMELKALPLSGHGKVDRKSLPTPDLSAAGKAYEAPRNHIEQQLAGIWQELLGITQVGVHDNFFEMGGHSLIMIQLLDKMRKYSLSLELKDLFTHQTIGEQALLIKVRETEQAISRMKGRFSTEGDQTSHLQLLQPGSNGNPIYIIPGIHGACEGYFELAGTIECGCPVYGIQMQGLWEGEDPISSMEGIAMQHIKWIKEVQPEGPYRFISHSFGGMVMYEMIRQLEKENDRVELAVILDTVLDPGDNKNDKAKDIMEFVAEYFEFYKLTNRGHREWIRKMEVELSALPHRDMFPYLSNALLERFSGSGPVKTILRQLKLQVYNDLIQYWPEEMLRTELVVAKAGNAVRKFSDPSLGWSAYAEKVVEMTIPGDHSDMIRMPYVETLGKFVSSLLLNNLQHVLAS